MVHTCNYLTGALEHIQTHVLLSSVLVLSSLGLLSDRLLRSLRNDSLMDFLKDFPRATAASATVLRSIWLKKTKKLTN